MAAPDHPTSQVVKAIGVTAVYPMEAGEPFAAAFSQRTLKDLRRVNVRPDGHCGAYVLAVVHLAMTRRALGRMQVRHRIYEAVLQRVQPELAARHARKFARAYRDVAERSFLNQPEMVAFLHQHRLSVYITSPRARSAPSLYTYEVADAVGAVFLLFSDLHWQLLAHRSASTPNAFEAVWTPQAAAALKRQVQRRSHVHEGETVEAYFASTSANIPFFYTDFGDRIWI